MKKRKGRTQQKLRSRWKGMDREQDQVRRAAERRKPGDKPSKGMRRYGL